MTRFIVACVLLLADTGLPAAAQLENRPALESLIGAARAYVTKYEQELSLLVSEELYVQQMHRAPVPRGSSSFPSAPIGPKRILRSDYLLVKLAGGGGWMPFRDVFEVDGKPLHDRSSRLERLFLEPSAASMDQASALMQESSRFNIGPVIRNINIPLLGMLLLSEEVGHRFSFERESEEKVGGHHTWRVRYRETARPTLIRGLRNADVPLEGQLWIAPDNGTVLRTHLAAANATVRSLITVDFRHDPSLELWVPGEMREIYRSGSVEITGVATYSNVRKFQVSTDELIRKPPGT